MAHSYYRVWLRVIPVLPAMVNYRPPPPPFSTTQQNQMSSWCRYDPMLCVRQVVIEALFLAAAYASMLLLTGGAVPGVRAVLTFVATFVVLCVAARMVSDDLGNKISITAISGIGAKTVSMLAPRFVGW